MIIVFGSLNIDMMLKVEHLPAAGETVKSPFYEWVPGGKGANQAVAAARASGTPTKVAMVGKVGDDGFGTRCINNMKKEGVNYSGIGASALPTGCAAVIYDDKAENQIVVASGANLEATCDQVPNEVLEKGHVVLMQMEVPPQQNWELIKRAHEKGARTILNLAPAAAIPKEALDALDYLIVNQIEARQISEKLGLKIETDAMKLAHSLASNCDLTCIVTIGAQGSVAATKDKGWRTKAMNIGEPVDTTGSGDSFCGAFAAAIHHGLPLENALKQASIAGSLACMEVGAQSAMPLKDEIEDHLENLDDPEVISF